MSETEPRRIRKIIREPIEAGTREFSPPTNPFPAVPAGHSRRGAITTQKVTAKKPPRTRATLTYALTKPRSIEGYVTLTELAAERGVQAQLARLWVKRVGLEKPPYGWRWKEGTRVLKQVRKALGLPQESKS